jgi:MFS family permease
MSRCTSCATTSEGRPCIPEHVWSIKESVALLDYACPNVFGHGPASDWWERRRKYYSLALILAGLCAFASYAATASLACANDVDVEITIFTILFQGVVIAMASRTSFITSGAWAEQHYRPSDVGRFRRRLFAIGLTFSVALPFSIPVLLALKCSEIAVFNSTTISY